MVAISFTFPPAEYLIPAGMKISTIRRRNLEKEGMMKRIGELQLFWKQRTPECKLLAHVQLKELKVIGVPIIEFIHTAPPEVIYGEGFGFDRTAMENFFTSTYDKETLGKPGAFYIVSWFPPCNRLVI